MSTCPSCKKANDEASKFCTYCGEKLGAIRVPKEEPKQKEIPKPKNKEIQSEETKKSLWPGLLIIIVIVGVVLVSVLAFTGRFSSPFTPTGSAVAAQECADVQVPYEDQEAYTEQVPYVDYENEEVDLKFIVVEHNLWESMSGFNVVEKASVKVRNMDTESGLFKVKYTFITLDGNFDFWDSHQLFPGDIGEFNFKYDKKMNQDVRGTYDVYPGTKTVVKPVTRYRTVTNYRIVTKYKTESRCN